MATRHRETAQKLNTELLYKNQNTDEASTQLLIDQACWMPWGQSRVITDITK